MQDGNPVTVGEARAALAEPAAAIPKRAVGAAGCRTRARTRSAYWPTRRRDEWWPEERDAWRTLAAATPEVRAEALQEAQTDGWITNAPTGSLSDGADDSPTIGS